MTKQERTKPDIINASRKKRIAAGSGMKVEDVNKLLKQFEQIKQMMKQFSGGGMFGKKKGRFGKKLPFPF
jgi:signal recognition particle subunit SRP54